MKTLQERIAANIDISAASGCWNWKLSKDGCGYGRIKVAKRLLMAHRVSFEDSFGAIPDGLQLDHLCRNRACVNPAHLEPVTPRENTMRGQTVTAANSLKTHCVHGHPFSGDNLHLTHKGTRRSCRTCHRRRNSESKRKRRLQKPR